MHTQNIYNQPNVADYKKNCLGVMRNRNSHRCKACDDFMECTKLQERWERKTIEKHIFISGINRIDRKITKNENKSSRPTRQELINQILALEGLLEVN